MFHKENFYNSVICARNLFAACLEVEDLHVERVAQSMDLLRTLIKLDLFELQREETISDFFVRVVLTRLAKIFSLLLFFIYNLERVIFDDR